MKVLKVEPCSYCGNQCNVYTRKQLESKNRFCNYNCQASFIKANQKPNCECSMCGKLLRRKPYRLKRSKHQFCSVACNDKYKEVRYMGLNNPNKKYKFNEDYLEKIDSKDKAYFLGWIASEGTLNKNGIAIQLQASDSYILDYLNNLIGGKLKLRKVIRDGNNRSDMVVLTINSKKMKNDVTNHLNCDHKISDNVFFDLSNYPTEIQSAFTQAYFEGDGCLRSIDNRYPECTISSNSEKMIRSFKFVYGGSITKSKKQFIINFNGNKCLDFLSQIYNKPNFCLHRKRDLYLDYSVWVPSLSGHGSKGSNLLFKWNKSRKDAIAPFKARSSDSGWDLTLLEKVMELGDVEFYSTGIKVLPEYGWYFDLVPRSSISKTDYMLANSVGVIDRTYVGEILVPLRKMVKDARPLDLPGRYVQIIPRPIIHVDLIEVDQLEDTERGSNGFGSSGN